MIQVDLITGFLGSGKTTFLRKYARYWINQGVKIAILENDFGAVNVDRMLLQDLEGDYCGVEMIAGGCDKECHQRRFRTKLISLSMQGYKRVLIEPSGIYDVDEFFDTLYDEPLDQWYEAGNVIAIVDAGLEEQLSKEAEFLLASEVAEAGCVLLSHTQEVPEETAKAAIDHVNRALEAAHCGRRLGEGDVICKNWDDLTEEDFKRITSCGYRTESYEKMDFEEKDVFQSLYFLELPITREKLEAATKKLLMDDSYGHIFRIKGFLEENGSWIELNATHRSFTVSPIPCGQAVLIVIGEGLLKEKIEQLFT